MAKRTLDRPVEGEERAQRTKRVPVGKANRLVAATREGFKRRWVSAVEDRIDVFLAAGYNFVHNTGSEDKSVSRTQDASSMDSRVSKQVGSGTLAYLMEIPLEYYIADQLEKQKEVDEIDQAIKGQGKDRLGHAAYGEGVSVKQKRF